ncbi:hypothetical protein PAPYR_5513 [Paratrimastix pyriformis]|uniref:Uncharacterized protein n=1 Tax=Paratrimastix pyriformis TaxID=342808 RepID=A0ABQ8UPW7_9EUKA|nr:hypothetical protein PAPYR_5513 [Paratrimastix pyriformis]
MFPCVTVSCLANSVPNPSWVGPCPFCREYYHATPKNTHLSACLLLNARGTPGGDSAGCIVLDAGAPGSIFPRLSCRLGTWFTLTTPASPEIQSLLDFLRGRLLVGFTVAESAKALFQLAVHAGYRVESPFRVLDMARACRTFFPVPSVRIGSAAGRSGTPGGTDEEEEEAHRTCSGSLMCQAALALGESQITKATMLLVRKSPYSLLSAKEFPPLMTHCTPGTFFRHFLVDDAVERARVFNRWVFAWPQWPAPAWPLTAPRGFVRPRLVVMRSFLAVRLWAAGAFCPGCDPNPARPLPIPPVRRRVACGLAMDVKPLFFLSNQLLFFPLQFHEDAVHCFSVHAPLDNSAHIVALLEDFPVEPILVVSQLPGGCFLLSLVPQLPLSFCFGFAPDPPLDCADPPCTLPCVWCADIDSVAALFRKVRPSVIRASPPPAGPSTPGPKRWRGMAMHCAPAHRDLLLRNLPGARPRLLLPDDLLQEMGTGLRGICGRSAFDLEVFLSLRDQLVQIRGQNEAVALQPPRAKHVYHQITGQVKNAFPFSSFPSPLPPKSERKILIGAITTHKRSPPLIWLSDIRDRSAQIHSMFSLCAATRIAEFVPGPVDEELIPAPSNDRSLPSGEAPDDGTAPPTSCIHEPHLPPPSSPRQPPHVTSRLRPLDTGRPPDRSAALSSSDRPTAQEQPLPLSRHLPASPHHAHEPPLPLSRRPLPLPHNPPGVHAPPDPPAVHVPPDPPARVIGLKHRREPALPPHNPLAAPPFPDHLLTPTSQQLPLPTNYQRGHLRRRPNM